LINVKNFQQSKLVARSHQLEALKRSVDYTCLLLKGGYVTVKIGALDLSHLHFLININVKDYVTADICFHQCNKIKLKKYEKSIKFGK